MPYEPQDWPAQKAELDAWNEASLPHLVQHIVERYHREARIEMARLEAQAEEAALLEGREHPELVDIRDEVQRFCLEMRRHLQAEERSLFPALLDRAEGRAVPLHAALLEPMSLLQDEHEAGAGLLKRLRALTQGFTPPGGAHSGQRRLYETLQSLSDSLYRHIYLENQVLFQRVRQEG